MSMSASVKKRAVEPLQRMLLLVESVIHNPLKPLKARPRRASTHEAAQVEHALVKFGSLLQIGFGEAGAKVIHHHMKDGTFDDCLPGRITHAIFGFCDIRDFTPLTEVLQGDVVQLVNGVAKHVHQAVVDNHGAANKNIGDAFLSVWKPKGRTPLQSTADAALRACVRCARELATAPDIQSMALLPAVQARLPGYTLRLGYGLHYGWAVEGAIGSRHKIDASYLSPHVNIASRLEGATKQFGVMILVSEEFFCLLSSHIQVLMRVVDRVTLKGSAKPTCLYTYDVPLEPKPRIDSTSPFPYSRPEGLVPPSGGHGPPRPDHVPSTNGDVMRGELDAFFSEEAPPCTSSDLREHWTRAMVAYVGGANGQEADWQAAMDSLDLCLMLDPSDGPALALRRFILNHRSPEGGAPAGWPGYRALDEK